MSHHQHCDFKGPQGKQLCFQEGIIFYKGSYYCDYHFKYIKEMTLRRADHVCNFVKQIGGRFLCDKKAIYWLENRSYSFCYDHFYEYLARLSTGNHQAALDFEEKCLREKLARDGKRRRHDIQVASKRARVEEAPLDAPLPEYIPLESARTAADQLLRSMGPPPQAPPAPPAVVLPSLPMLLPPPPPPSDVRHTYQRVLERYQALMERYEVMLHFLEQKH